MSNIVKTDGGSLASLLHGKGGGLTIPKPYERDIFCLILLLPGQRTLKVLKNWLSILMLTISWIFIVSHIIVSIPKR